MKLRLDTHSLLWVDGDIKRLPRIHKDAFDRLLIAQAKVEGVTLLTNDATDAQYRGPVRLMSR